jgi:hypothetical protein
MSELAETANRFTGRLIETPTEALRPKQDAHALPAALFHFTDAAGLLGILTQKLRLGGRVSARAEDVRRARERTRNSHPIARAAGAVTAEINPEPTRAAVDAALALSAEQAPPPLDRCA